MANFEIPENPKYTKEIRKFEPTDPAHADLFNAVTQTLLNNDEFLRKVVEQYKAELQSSMSQQQEELTQYTDTKISDLIGGAPETLDTLKEVADAIQENEGIVDALNDAIGTKQSKLGIGTFSGNIDMIGNGGLPQSSSICWCQSTVVAGTLPYESSNAYWFLLKTDIVLDNSTIRSQKAVIWEAEKTSTFERLFTNGKWFDWKKCLSADGDLKDTTVSFTSGDDLNPTGWTAIGKIFSGAKFKDILNGFSTGIKNLRFLWKLCGENDISGLADGTITGALSQLNTEIVPNYFSHVIGAVDKQGWYRIAKANGIGFNSCVISLKRSFNAPGPEYQKVQFLAEPNKQKFVSLAAISNVHMWTKIRETWDGANSAAYLELYQCQDSNTNLWYITLADAIGAYNSEWKAMKLELTQETVSGVAVLASLDLPDNNPA